MVDYNFYKDVFGGELSPETFSYFEDKAIYVIKTYAPFYKENDMDVQKCLCAVAKELYKQSKLDGNINSENNDGYSVSFKDDKELEKRLYKIVYRYLSTKGYMYRGKL